MLIRPDLDLLKPGEHTGTFRGNQIAFVAAKAALEFADREQLGGVVLERAAQVERFLTSRVLPLHPDISIRGRGLIWGVDVSRCGGPDLARAVGRDCFENGLIIERAGRNDTVLKIMPPLTIEPALLEEGLTVLTDALDRAISPVRGAREPTAA